MPTPKRERKREGKQARQEALRRERERARRNRQIRNAAIVVVGLVIVVFVVTRVQGRGDKVATQNTTSTSVAAPTTIPTKPGSAECPKADGSTPKKTTFDGPPKKCIDASKTYEATVTTDAGSFVIALDAKKAPSTVNNFVFLARYHFYDGVVFHRVIPGFVVQGGDPQGDGSGGPGYKFGDELPKPGAYKIGSLAMANSGPDTNGSQFFVVTGDQGVQLPPSYSLFGAVTSGMDVVKKIEADGSPEGAPKVKHSMQTVTIRET
jgi:cyclophilin family peptidyl-prolyl cis-trans isomerase